MASKTDPEVIKTPTTPGSDLVPDLSKVAAESATSPWWIGVLPTCPMTRVDVGGQSFPTLTEKVSYSHATGTTMREPRAGAIAHLTQKQVDRIKERLAHKVVRFHGAPAEDRLMPGMQDLSDQEQPSRRGFIVTIPTKDEQAMLDKRGRYRPFTPRPTDEPVAQHLYMVRGDMPRSSLPPSIAEAGIEA